MAAMIFVVHYGAGRFCVSPTWDMRTKNVAFLHLRGMPATNLRGDRNEKTYHQSGHLAHDEEEDRSAW